MSNKSWSGFKVVAFRNGHELARADSKNTLREALEEFRKHVNVAINQGWEYAQTTILVEYMPDLTSDPDAYRLHWECTFGDGEMSGPGTMGNVFYDVCRYFKRVLHDDMCVTDPVNDSRLIVAEGIIDNHKWVLDEGEDGGAFDLRALPIDVIARADGHRARLELIILDKPEATSEESSEDEEGGKPVELISRERNELIVSKQREQLADKGDDSRRVVDVGGQFDIVYEGNGWNTLAVVDANRKILGSVRLNASSRICDTRLRGWPARLTLEILDKPEPTLAECWEAIRGPVPYAEFSPHQTECFNRCKAVADRNTVAKPLFVYWRTDDVSDSVLAALTAFFEETNE